jgi:hypothetical protein
MRIELQRLAIKEGNLLINKFMSGANLRAAYYAPLLEYDLDGYIKELKYHKKWDWLMPVVEKIESTDYWRVTIIGPGCAIHDHASDNCESLPCIEVDHTYILFNDVETKIAAAWHAVVNWMLWYNKYAAK